MDDGVASLYQGLLRITNGAGFRRLVPVTTEVSRIAASFTSATAAAGDGAAAAVAIVDMPAGLWFGSVKVDQVAWVTFDAPVIRDRQAARCGCIDGFCVSTADDNMDGLGDMDGISCLVCRDPLANPLTCSERIADLAICDCPEVASLEAARIPQANDPASRTEPRPVASPFRFPVIVHLNDLGEATLLTEVTLKYEPFPLASWACLGGLNDGVLCEFASDCPPDGAQLGRCIRGRHVLVTPACTDCDDLAAGDAHDGRPFSQRLSSAAYAFDGDLPLDVTLAGDGVEGVIVLDPDHPMNPFRHTFHPDHDCDQVGECYKVTRDFAFRFEAGMPAGGAAADPLSFVSGIYSEMITLSARPAKAAGSCECVIETGEAQGLCEGGPISGANCASTGDCNCPTACVCDVATKDCDTGTACTQTQIDNGTIPCCVDRDLFSVNGEGSFDLTRISEIGTLNR